MIFYSPIKHHKVLFLNVFFLLSLGNLKSFFEKPSPVVIDKEFVNLYTNFDLTMYQTLTIENSNLETKKSVIINGRGNSINFSKSSKAMLFLEENLKLTVKNTTLDGYDPNAVNYGLDSSLSFGGNTVLNLKDNIELNADVQTQVFADNSTINGYLNTLKISAPQKIKIFGPTELCLKNLKIKTTVSNPFNINDDAIIKLENTSLEFDSPGLNFDKGNIVISGKCEILGRNSKTPGGKSTFTFSSKGTLTVLSGAELVIEKGTILKYQADPEQDLTISSTKRHFVMTDPSSVMFLNGCTLQSTETAFALDHGRLLIGDRVTFEGSTSEGHEIELGSSLQVEILAAAMLDLKSPLKHIPTTFKG